MSLWTLANCVAGGRAENERSRKLTTLLQTNCLVKLLTTAKPQSSVNRLVGQTSKVTQVMNHTRLKKLKRIEGSEIQLSTTSSLSIKTHQTLTLEMRRLTLRPSYVIWKASNCTTKTTSWSNQVHQSKPPQTTMRQTKPSAMRTEAVLLERLLLRL